MKHAKLGMSMAAAAAFIGASSVAVLAQPAPPEAPPHASLLAHFDEIDSNKDGKLSREELEAFHKTHGPPEGRLRDCRIFINRDSVTKPKGAKKEDEVRLPFGGPPLLMMDKNADGKLSREEFLKGQAEMFDRMDANKDGFLTSDERPSFGGMGCPPPGDMPPPPPPNG